MSKISVIHDRSRVLLYVQVASVMRQRIEKGYWAEGDKISTLEELEAEFSVARVTIRQAIELLRNEGLLEARQGRGTFVVSRPRHNRWFNLASDFDSMVASLKENKLKHVHIRRDAPLPKLQGGEGELAAGYTFLRSVQYNNNEPFSIVNLYLARHIFDRDPKQFTRTAALPRIIEMGDVPIIRANQILTIGVADPETAGLLNIGLGEPTADCRLVLVDDEGVAIYIANIHYHKDSFTLRINLLDG